MHHLSTIFKQQMHWCLQEGKESKIQEWVSCVKSSEEFVLKAAAVKTGSTKFADLHFRLAFACSSLHAMVLVVDAP